MLEKLSYIVWNRAEFHTELDQIVSDHLGRHFGVEQDEGYEYEIEGEVLARLLESAAILSLSPEGAHKRAALRISAATLQLYGEGLSGVQNAAHVVFARLGNFPSSDLARDIYPDSAALGWSAPLWLEAEWYRISSTINLLGKSFTLTPFQKRLWESLRGRGSISVSAPTSAGKSFILQKHIVSRLVEEGEFVAVYIVPTRALISQVSQDLSQEMAGMEEGELDNVAISSIPIPLRDIGSDRVVYVLTQERLQVLLEIDSEISVDLLIVDEAQSIQDDGRGVVLQSVVERLLGAHSVGQVLFAAPLASNPEIFNNIFEIHNMTSVLQEESPVLQNIIIANRVKGRRKRYNLSIYIDGELKNIGDRVMSNSFSSVPQTLANISWELGKGDINIVYNGKPAECERVAGMLTDLLSSEDELVDAEVLEFASFVQEVIYPTFTLSSVLAGGVAYHYGNMPSIVREGIEELFGEGKLRYIVCTSTLLHGVNLPARNVFLCKPSTGAYSDPLTSGEFWNLAGRAGRLRNDFEGNVIMIDLDKWKTNPLEGPVRQKVKSSMASLINEKTLELIEFIRDTEHASGSKAGLENTFVKLFVDYRAGVIGDTLLRAAPEMEQEDLDEVISALEFASDHVRLDASMIRANINISPYRQQEMYDTLSAYMGRVDPQGLVPVHPLSSEASERTKFIFEIISRVFEKRNDGSYTYFAQLAMSWMRGGTYREIIGSAIEYRRGIGRRESDQAIIRNVLREINNDLKFKYVKYTRGYINMLIASLAGAGQSVPEDAVVDMPIYLELGASSSTMISLISLGLSRTTASILSGMAPSSGWSREEVLEWLRRRRFMTAELPARCRREVDALSLQAHG